MSGSTDCVANGGVNECWQCCKTSNCEGTFSQADGIWLMNCSESNGEMGPLSPTNGNDHPGCVDDGEVGDCSQCCEGSDCVGENSKVFPSPLCIPKDHSAHAQGKRPTPGSQFVAAPVLVIDNKSGESFVWVTLYHTMHVVPQLTILYIIYYNLLQSYSIVRAIQKMLLLVLLMPNGPKSFLFPRLTLTTTRSRTKCLTLLIVLRTVV